MLEIKNIKRSKISLMTCLTDKVPSNPSLDNSFVVPSLDL